ncbi:MAG TPA: amidohydrolase family protein, partial [Candidatus Binatia bacterium]|nr:amidohydrolase family protein [Candidatus Binatia bacterium]
MTRPFTLAAALLAAALVAAAGRAQPVYDLLIRRGRILDGTGAPERVADVAIRGDRIVEIGDLTAASAARVIDAAGLYVTPGFIDLHSHADRSLALPGLNVALNDLTQGITTVVVGQDGRSAWPVGGRIEQTIALWRRRGLGLNAILLVGHGSVRREILGDENRDPTPEELSRMRALVRAAMEGGAYGISTGLAYLPGRFAKTDEVIALTAEVKPYGGFYISHLRNQGDRLLESVEETIRIGRETGVTVVATHFKSSGRRNFGKARAAMARIDGARREGVAIYTDVYPWSTSSDGIDVDLLPPEAYAIAARAASSAARTGEAGPAFSAAPPARGGSGAAGPGDQRPGTG